LNYTDYSKLIGIIATRMRVVVILLLRSGRSSNPLLRPLPSFYLFSCRPTGIHTLLSLDSAHSKSLARNLQPVRLFHTGQRESRCRRRCFGTRTPLHLFQCVYLRTSLCSFQIVLLKRLYCFLCILNCL
jgi:hypothetical protein